MRELLLNGAFALIGLAVVAYWGAAFKNPAVFLTLKRPFMFTAFVGWVTTSAFALGVIIAKGRITMKIAEGVDPKVVESLALDTLAAEAMYLNFAFAAAFIITQGLDGYIAHFAPGRKKPAP